MDADNHVLTGAELVAGRVEQGNVEETVVVAAPSPVYIYEAFLVVAVQHKGMAGIELHVSAAVIERTHKGQLIENHFHPLGVAVAVALLALGLGHVEIGAQTGGGIL